MKYNANIISTILFESDNVVVYKIPPGDRWNLIRDNVVWRGNFRLIEEETIPDDKETNEEISQSHNVRTPFLGLRAKVELYNTINDEEVAWGEVWYNPLDRGVPIANNNQETIQMSHSIREYKIIAQLPGSGYCPLKSYEDDDDEDLRLQIALGLRFEQFAAISFLESLSLYKRRFRSYQEQNALQPNEVNNNSATESAEHKQSKENHEQQKDNEEEDDDDDEFGDFVSN